MMLDVVTASSPAEAGAQLRDADGDVQPSVSATGATGPRPSPGWGDARIDCTRDEFRTNARVPIRGTPLGDMLADTPMAKLDAIEFVRVVAATRIACPMSMVRLSAGRESMSEAAQALAFMAGAESIITGYKLLTTGNAGDSADAALFAKLGLKALSGEEPMRVAAE